MHNLIITTITILVALFLIGLIVTKITNKNDFNELMDRLEEAKKQEQEHHVFINRKFFASKRYRKCLRIEHFTKTYLFKNLKYNVYSNKKTS